MEKESLFHMQSSYKIDVSTPFLLPSLSLRGCLVRLQEVNMKILEGHAYPIPVAKILSEFLAVGGVLSRLLKYEGVFTLQTKTSGPLGPLVVDVTHEGYMRGYAQVKLKKIREKNTFKELLGKGFLSFIVDQGFKGERYQGIVNLDYETVTHAIEQYFDQSEQLETRLYITSEKTKEGIWKSGALLLQQLPSKQRDDTTWPYIEALLNTLSTREFLNSSIHHETLLYWLFHEVGITVFEPQLLKAQCRCSKERIKAYIKTLAQEEIADLLEKGPLQITCEFCNHLYEFDRQGLMMVH